MPLLPVPLRSLLAPSPVAAPRRAAPPHLLVSRRSPLAGALLFLSLGAVAGVRSPSSVQMESASTTVPSIVVYVTVPNKEAGKKLAGSIISEKLAACVNIVPGIESVYWWEGKACRFLFSTRCKVMLKSCSS